MFLTTKYYLPLIFFGVFNSIEATNHRLTPLLVNATNCIAEKLAATDKYSCDEHGNVYCINGWSNPSKLCQEPSCNINGATCDHGKCISPNVCSCGVGWTGPLCDKCVPLGGCQHGTCNGPCECNCKHGWTGTLCNKPECKGCKNGACHEPNKCICEAGWKGPNCDECITHSSCKHGRCDGQPYSCVCDDGWTGLGCTKPVCREGCNLKYGRCHGPGECICNAGYTGRTCDECVPYPGCKGTCVNNIPWTCTLFDDNDDSHPDKWSKWTQWSTCSKSCGSGVQTRNRVCGDHHGVSGSCVGATSESRKCINKYCKIDGGWSRWSRWTGCNARCGSGIKQRSRTCTKPSPKYGGSKCHGPHSETLKCFTKHCPLNGGWSSWQEWSSCSSSCGEGSRNRIRKCDAPSPAYGGRSCFGSSREKHSCNLGDCPRDPEWLIWERWTSCSKTCGLGEKSRVRRCSGISKSVKGFRKTCPGGLTEDVEVVGCTEREFCSVDGNWSKWTSWTKCSVSCGSGKRFRERSCNYPAPLFGGKNCAGSAWESSKCLEKDCPVDGKWISWGKWSKCSKSCGGHGTKTRSRKCSEPQYGGRPCSGIRTETQQCGVSQCPVDGKFLNWGSWGSCSATCGNGLKSRSRNCVRPSFGGKPCIGATTESASCFVKFCPLPSQWNQWSHWSSCSVTCGVGKKSRNRNCGKSNYGVSDCHGLKFEEVSCHEKDCHVPHLVVHSSEGWGEWSEWTSCSSTCGSASKTRSRSCQGYHCDGDTVESVDCYLPACHVSHGNWAQWSHWGSCSKTCGGGVKSRERVCSNPHGGQHCSGSGWEQEACNTYACATDGVWEQWSQWTPCSRSCGGGVKSRERKCNNFSGGRHCDGTGWEQTSCKQQACGVDGNWGHWGQWAHCSVTCGSGTRLRERECNNPAPVYGGKRCEGKGWDKESCFKGACFTNGNWGQWTQWTSCSVSCGTGTNSRKRHCNNPAPANGGNYCAGDSNETKECTNNGKYCPIDGGLTEWTQWSPCTVECLGDKGDQVSRRFCWNPRPQYGGKPCHGETKKIRDCTGTVPKQESNPSGICFHVGGK